ncbi:MAG: DUF1189 domain-containing protein [Rickettsiales bacterium]|nr:DUF1189 domain-containing protein [Rickettsiales bacterium]
MTLKNFFRIIILSFYSPNLYIEVAKKWKHWGLGFLLKFSILISLISSICLFIFVSNINFKNQDFVSFIQQIPEMKIIEDRAVFVDENITSPIYVGPVKNFLVVDLDARTSEKYPDTLIAFTAYGMVMNLLDSSYFTISYNDFLMDQDEKIINTSSLISFMLKTQKKLLAIIIILGVTSGSLIYFAITLFKTAFYASVASLCSGAFKFKLTFKQLLRLAIIANAPAFIISTVFMLIFFNSKIMAMSEFISTTLYLLYFMGGILFYLKSQKNK